MGLSLLLARQAGCLDRIRAGLYSCLMLRGDAPSEFSDAAAGRWSPGAARPSCFSGHDHFDLWAASEISDSG